MAFVPFKKTLDCMLESLATQIISSEWMNFLKNQKESICKGDGQIQDKTSAFNAYAFVRKFNEILNEQMELINTGKMDPCFEKYFNEIEILKSKEDPQIYCTPIKKTSKSRNIYDDSETEYEENKVSRFDTNTSNSEENLQIEPSTVPNRNNSSFPLDNDTNNQNQQNIEEIIVWTEEYELIVTHKRQKTIEFEDFWEKDKEIKTIETEFVATSVTQNNILDGNIRDEETNTSTETLASHDEDSTHSDNSSISLNIKKHSSDHRNQNVGNHKQVELTKERKLVAQDAKTSIPKKKKRGKRWKKRHRKPNARKQEYGRKRSKIYHEKIRMIDTKNCFREMITRLNFEFQRKSIIEMKKYLL